MEKINEKIKKLFNHFQNRNFEYVIRECRILLKKFPEHLVLYNLFGLTLQQINRLPDAKIAFTRALQLNSNNVAALNNLGSVCKILEEFESAEEYFVKALKIQPKYINALSNYGNLKRELNNFNGAIEYYKKALEIDGNQFIIHHNLALAYQGIGKFDLAKKHALESLKINPNHTLSHKMLSASTKYQEGNDHFKLMKEKLEKGKMNDEQKIHINFSISKAYEDMNDFKKSYLHMVEGNSLKRNQIKYNKKNDIDLFEKIKKNFNNFDFNKKNKINNLSKKIIFICGMPRSGTTLIEQIIASHKNVYGAGELGYLSKIVEKNFFENNILKTNIALYDISKATKISDEYFSFLKAHKFEQNIITDKAPLNFRWIGFIKIFFPNSKIIHCSRNSKDNCLSLYKNLFDSDNLNWCYDKKELSTYYNLYFDLIKFWKEKIPNFIYNAKYEEIVENQEQETKKLLEFCDLDWDPNCLSFYKNSKTPIKTASIVQARKPIYKSSVHLNQKYKDYFKELFNSLASN